MIDLKGRTALVTGWGSGIGKAAPTALAARGAHVLVAGRLQPHLVHPTPARLWVHPADLDLVAVLASGPDTERESARSDLSDRRELASDRNRVAQRQEIEPDIHRQLGLSSEHRGRCDQPVRARPYEEAHMIADADVVDSGVSNASKRRLELLRIAVRLAYGRKQSDADPSHRTEPPPGTPGRR